MIQGERRAWRASRVVGAATLLRRHAGHASVGDRPILGARRRAHAVPRVLMATAPGRGRRASIASAADDETSQPPDIVVSQLWGWVSQSIQRGRRRCR